MSRRLLVFAPNWLGDAVMALPALADVVRGSTDTTIDLAARPAIAPLAPLVPGIARTVLLGSRRDSVAAVRAGGYDAALLFTNSFNTAWIVRAAGVPERWGYRNEFRSILLTRAFDPPARVHQATYYQRLTTALGYAPGPLEPGLAVTDELRTIGRDVLTAAGWDGLGALVAVAPGAAFGGAKRWPADQFGAAIAQLGRDNVRAVLIGARADRAAAHEVLAATHSTLRPIDLVGTTDLSELAAVLTHCRTLITNDSGAMHFAAALGTNVTAVFGPTNERETSPLGAGRVSVVHADVWCRPCMLRECPLTHQCMRSIPAERVAQEARMQL